MRRSFRTECPTFKGTYERSERGTKGEECLRAGRMKLVVGDTV